MTCTGVGGHLVTVLIITIIMVELVGQTAAAPVVKDVLFFCRMKM